MATLVVAEALLLTSRQLIDLINRKQATPIRKLVAVNYFLLKFFILLFEDSLKRVWLSVAINFCIGGWLFAPSKIVAFPPGTRRLIISPCFAWKSFNVIKIKTTAVEDVMKEDWKTKIFLYSSLGLLAKSDLLARKTASISPQSGPHAAQSQRPLQRCLCTYSAHGFSAPHLRHHPQDPCASTWHPRLLPYRTCLTREWEDRPRDN